MDIKDSLKNLSKDTQEILKKIYKLEDNSDISPEEINALKVKILSLYDNVSGIEWMIRQGSSIAEPEKSVSVEMPQVVTDKPEEPVSVEVSQAAIDKPKESMPEEPVPGEVSEGMTDDRVVSEKPEKIVSSARKMERSAGVISDKFRNSKYRNEALKKEMPINDLSSKFYDKPIKDIPAAIGINEKFRYIRELFDGDSSSYNKTIAYLNEVKSESDAVEYFNSNFDWDHDDKLVRMLLNLTSRKLRYTKK